ncbi:MAG: choice-of-anchor J domain-containing protein, partial [Clostridia bacterium]|nr:choice-of-anchor J domain-containing protein [Clostridia bacterium]
LGAIGSGGAEVTALYIKNNLPIDPIEVPDVTVTFVDGIDNAVIDTMTVEAGTVLDESTFPAAPEHEGYIFVGWNYNGAAVYADTTITAQYQDPNATIWDFETDPNSQGFHFIDQDGDGYNWNWYYGDAYADFNFHEGIGFAASQSYDNNYGALTPDNWMVTPAFSGTQLSFWAQGQDPSWAAEYLGVFVSTDNCATWSSELAGFTINGNDTQYTVDLSAYEGQTIKAAIRHYNVTDQYWANVDYIEVGGGDTPPVTPAPVTPAPVTPAPVTPEPVTPEPGEGIIWDFEQDPEAQGFILLDQDGDGFNWMWCYGADWSGFNFHEGQGFITSQSYDNNWGALTPDNWLITPEFNGTQLTFWAQGQDPSWAAEYLGVFVSTDGGSTWSSELAGFTINGNDTQYTVDLSAYAGQTIKAAIRHYNITDQYWANVDYIEVLGGGDTPPVVGVIGDTNLDGEVTIADAILALRHIMGLETLTGEALEQADANGDGNVTIEDCILILRAALDLIELG